MSRSAIDQPGYSDPGTQWPLTNHPADWPRIAAFWLLWQGVRVVSTGMLVVWELGDRLKERGARNDGVLR